MSTDAVCEWANLAAKANKIAEVRRVKGRGDTDIPTIIMGYRGADPAVSIMLPPHRDWMLHFANLVANAFSCDSIALTFETFVVIGSMQQPVESVEDLEDHPSQINPDTGKKWAEGEMAAYFNTHGVDNGVVSECLNIMVYNRAGDHRMGSLPYRIEGTEVTWTFDDARFSDGVGGYLHDELTQIMDRPTMFEVATRELPPEVFPEHDDALFTMDKAALGIAQEHAEVNEIPFFSVALLAEKGSRRHQRLRALRIANAMIQDPRAWSSLLN